MNKYLVKANKYRESKGLPPHKSVEDLKRREKKLISRIKKGEEWLKSAAAHDKDFDRNFRALEKLKKDLDKVKEEIDCELNLRKREWFSNTPPPPRRKVEDISDEEATSLFN